MSIIKKGPAFLQTPHLMPQILRLRYDIPCGYLIPVQIIFNKIYFLRLISYFLI